MLKAVSITAGYGKKTVLNSVSVDVSSNEIVTLIGHNGAGKSTLLKAIFGMIPVWHGQIFLDGRPVNLLAPRIWLQSGVVYIPQGNQVFNNLTVLENLEMAGIALAAQMPLQDRMEYVLSLFPTLKLRLKQPAGRLSGGEKQMLALSIALIPSPRLCFSMSRRWAWLRGSFPKFSFEFMKSHTSLVQPS